MSPNIPSLTSAAGRHVLPFVQNHWLKGVNILALGLLAFHEIYPNEERRRQMAIIGTSTLALNAAVYVIAKSKFAANTKAAYIPVVVLAATVAFIPLVGIVVDVASRFMAFFSKELARREKLMQFMTNLNSMQKAAIGLGMYATALTAAACFIAKPKASCILAGLAASGAVICWLKS